MKKTTSIVFTGDIGFDRYMDRKWEDPELLSQGVLDFFHSADHVCANVEGALIDAVDDGSRGIFFHNMNPEATKVLKQMGADIWSIGNNHTMDAGREGILSIPCEIRESWHHLYDRVFTCRMDSPKWLVRFQESRVYSCQGQSTEPCNCVDRTLGALTIDNIGYGRYSGEIMLTRTDLKADPRVNVIGHVPENALLLLEHIRRGSKFTLVRP